MTVGFNDEHGYALALTVPLGDTLLWITLRVEDGDALTKPPHCFSQSPRDLKLLPFPWQPPYQNEVHFPDALS